jgi:hypothetical protein
MLGVVVLMAVVVAALLSLIVVPTEILVVKVQSVLFGPAILVHSHQLAQAIFNLGVTHEFIH